MDFADYTATTDRMRLRGYRFDDFDAFHDLHGREDVARYLPWETRDEPASRRALGRHQTMQLEKEGEGVTLAGFDLETGRLVGEFVLILRSLDKGSGEVGYQNTPGDPIHRQMMKCQ